MRVNVVNGGDEAFNALVYPQPSSAVISYLKNNIESAMSTVSNMSQGFIDNVKRMYSSVNGSEALLNGKLLTMNAGVHLNQNVIYPVHNFQDTNLIMQRYLMSCPEVSELNKNNMCHGFQETYLDLEEGVYGTDRTDYRDVMSGILTYEGEHGEGVFKRYYHTDGVDLDFIDKLSIITTWDNARKMINDRLDPTDPDNLWDDDDRLC